MSSIIYPGYILYIYTVEKCIYVFCICVRRIIYRYYIDIDRYRLVTNTQSVDNRSHIHFITKQIVILDIALY